MILSARALAISAYSTGALSQATPESTVEEVVVTGIRSSLASALNEKRYADNLVEMIQAEDIGKLPDQNLAEVLENVTGVQIISSFPWGFPVVQDDRGQLNASINYDVTEKLTVGVEAVNITEEEVTQPCVNEGALLCFQGLTDRRITVGATYRF